MSVCPVCGEMSYEVGAACYHCGRPAVLDYGRGVEDEADDEPEAIHHDLGGEGGGA